MSYIQKIVLAFGLLLPFSGDAIQNGLAVSYGGDILSNAAPSDTSGFSIAYTLQPDSFIWGNFSVGFNLSYGYWKTTSVPTHQSIDVYAAAPYLRWYFMNNAIATPFLQGSVGLAVMSNSYFGDQNLGSTLLFQDMGGIGLAYGASKNLTTTLQILHYSNASISSHNSGMTIPILLTLGYQF